MPQPPVMSSDHDKPITAATPAVPACPACQRTMTVTQITPSTSMIGVGETVYVCESCGIEAHRAAKRA